MEFILIKWHDTCSHQITSFLEILGVLSHIFCIFFCPMCISWYCFGVLFQSRRGISLSLLYLEIPIPPTNTLPSPPHLWVQKAERRVFCYNRVQLTITGSYHVEEQTPPRFLLIGTTGCLSGRTKAPFIISEIISQNIISD